MLEIIGSIDAKSWIGFFGVLIGAGLGFSGVIFANISSSARLKLQMEMEKQHERNVIKRERLEELYVLISKWINNAFSYYFNLTLVMKGKIDYNQYLDEIIEDGNSKKVDFQRIEMILNIYGRELLPLYEDILKSREKINNMASEHKNSYREGRDCKSYIKPYSLLHKELELQVENLKLKLAELASDI
ncbi:hypothetical protein ABMY47_10205 [Pseudoalteromonas sp. BZP1]|uniref:hypothetical protein n=1 Tax=unclassified Pseudoalteromonas TaxID=194690 RepID=UPI0007B95709|nr:hypothetical protein [Pseudoalteromonas sp. Cn5-37]KZY44181.1 hypothetical protein A3733_16185 [Pseudoalteromonas shioyasakiensis]MCF2917537.1 hypothetical protein [Pseudoalteromonas sp. Cn5-37]